MIHTNSGVKANTCTFTPQREYNPQSRIAPTFIILIKDTAKKLIQQTQSKHDDKINSYK